MSSWARPSGRVIRAAAPNEDVYVFGETRGDTRDVPAPLATAAEVLATADRRAAEIVAEAESRAAALVAEAQTAQVQIRQAAYQDGLEAGRQSVLDEVRQALDLLRAAAAEGKAIRDSIAEQSVAVVARGIALATRRVVGEYYESSPERTALACVEAFRAAAGQDVLAIRVHPGVVAAVEAALVDSAHNVRGDEAVEIGGCIVDLRHGTIDATLDARLSLMDLALAEAGGEVGQ